MQQPLNEIFDIIYPKTLIFSEQQLTTALKGTPFVSSKGTNNGISGYVEKIEKAKLYSKGAITVPLKGTVLHAFLQDKDFYCAHQIAVLIPKTVLSNTQKLFICACIRHNKYRYSYGRQADKTLKDLTVPSLTSFPDWVSAEKAQTFTIKV